MSKKILLTISILISNRPDTVRKCLDSVQPLLREVPSELILTDTGCGEQVRSIIEEYSDHIIDFEWCNDFAKARNAGLEQAKGEWFLYLDDDEWFEDTTEMIQFFNSGEYKKYGIGAYAQRNYEDREGNQYSDLIVGRMTRLEPDIKFIYSIHECFNRVVGKVKQFDVYVHHYGYVYDTEEALYLHVKRNVELLVIEHEREPNNMKHVLQLVQEYNVIHEQEKSLEYALKAIEIAERGEPLQEEFCLSSLYANAIICYAELLCFDEVIQKGEEFLKKKKKKLDPMVRAQIAGVMSMAYRRLSNPEKSFEMAKYYWDVYHGYLKDEKEFVYYVTNITCVCFEPWNKSRVLQDGVYAAILLGKYDIAYQWFQEADILHPRAHVDREAIKAIVNKLPELTGEAYHNFVWMCNESLKFSEIEAFIITSMMERCRQGKTSDERIQLAAAYRDCEVNHCFHKLSVIAAAVCAHEAGESYDKALADGLIKQLWDDLISNMVFMKEFDILRMMERLGIDAGEILEKIPYSEWQKELTQCFGCCIREDADWWNGRFAVVLAEQSMRMLLWNAFHGIYSAIWEANSSDQPSIDVMLQGLEKYAYNRKVLCEQIYKPEILENCRDVLSDEDQAAYKLIDLEKQMASDEYGTAVQTIKEIRILLPGLDPVMRYYLERLDEQVKAQEREQRQATNEMQVLAAGVKIKLRQLIASGNQQAALAVARQLSALVPEDKEVQQMIERLQ